MQQNLIIQLFTLMILTCMVVSCQNSSSKISGNESFSDENVVEIPEDFPPFYERFHTDSSFQMAHITFPLNASSDSTKWQKEDWVIHKPFNDMNGEFTRSFDNVNGMMIETIREKSGFVEIERRFGKVGPDYHLIYYRITSQFDQ